MESGSEMESPLQPTEQRQLKNERLPSLGRQSTIYSLTLDEFQHTISGSGKNFGSMNMDEFLNSIWTAEENQAQAQAQGTTSATLLATASSIPNTHNGVADVVPETKPSTDKMIARQHSLSRQCSLQGSLSIPEMLCRKTVEEVWSEIHKNEQHDNESSSQVHSTANTTQKQPTLGEMTLEDFLIRAGVVREQTNPPVPPQQTGYAMYANNVHPAIGPSFAARPVAPIGGVAAYQTIQTGVGDATGYPVPTKRVGGYSQTPSVVGYGTRLGNDNGGGFGQVLGLGLGSPVSPLSDGNGLDRGNGYGVEGASGGRKRKDGPVEKVVERRQRRMIKNRESAARSRARKQAYTVELEAELNQLKEENLRLKKALAELEMQRKHQYYEEEQMQSKAYKTNEKLRAIRRHLSTPF